MKYLAICLFCKDENDYLSEWLDYHLAIGVDHIIIYDNNSRVPVADSVRGYVDAGRVTVTVWPEATQGRQCRAYARCLAEFGHAFRWIGFFDVDEFVVPKSSASLPEFLTPRERYGGLAIFWLCFGSNGRASRPPGTGVVSAFTRRSAPDFGENDHVKSIVNPAAVVPVPHGDPHSFRYRPGYHAADEHGHVVPGPRRTPHTSDLIQLNHYVVRSRAEFVEKQHRGGGNSVGRSRPDRFFDQCETHCNEVEDLTAVRLSIRLGLIRAPRTEVP